MDTEAKSALDPVAGPMRVAPQRLGAMLSEARAVAGLDLGDISRDSRIPLRHLRAIEADSHDALPALPYTIGFVKSFARAVGRDPEAAAAQFRAETTKAPIVPMMAAIEPLDERRLPPRGLMTASIAGLVIVLAGVIGYSAGMFDRARPVAASTSAAPASAGSAVAPALAASAATTNAINTTAAPAVPVSQVPAVQATQVAAVQTGVTSQTADQTQSASTVAAGPVTITPSEDVWVKIYDRSNKNAVKIGVLPANVTYAVPAAPGLLLWTGKAGVLKVSVGGRAIPPLGKPVETVRDVSLAPADLLARAGSPSSVAR